MLHQILQNALIRIKKEGLWCTRLNRTVSLLRKRLLNQTQEKVVQKNQDDRSSTDTTSIDENSTNPEFPSMLKSVMQSISIVEYSLMSFIWKTINRMYLFRRRLVKFNCWNSIGQKNSSKRDMTLQRKHYLKFGQRFKKGSETNELSNAPRNIAFIIGAITSIPLVH